MVQHDLFYPIVPKCTTVHCYPCCNTNYVLIIKHYRHWISMYSPYLLLFYLSVEVLMFVCQSSNVRLTKNYVSLSLSLLFLLFEPTNNRWIKNIELSWNVQHKTKQKNLRESSKLIMKPPTNKFLEIKDLSKLILWVKVQAHNFVSCNQLLDE